jgi:ankyrin repeat protein
MILLVLIMKYLSRCFIFQFSILLGVSQTLFSAHYDELKTNELQNYLQGQGRTLITDINSVDLSRTVKELVKQRADPNIADELRGITALHYAAGVGAIDLIQFLAIDHCAAIENTEHWSSWTPLMWAARRGYQEAVVLLIGLGAHIQAINREGSTALSVAIGKAKGILATYDPYQEVLQEEHWLYRMIRIQFNDPLKHILIYSPQNVMKPLINQLDVHGQTPLDIAIATHNKEAIRLLLSYGANPLQGLYNSLRLAKRIPEWHQSITSKDGAQLSLYIQIYKAHQNHYLAILGFLPLPKEIISRIVEFVLASV